MHVELGYQFVGMLLPVIINYLDTAQVQLCPEFCNKYITQHINTKYLQSVPKSLSFIS